MLRRFYQTHVHPQLFRQTIQLTDGSTIRIVSISDKRSFVKIGVDAMSHPTWNPRVKNRAMLTESRELAKFREKYEDLADDPGLSDLGGLLGTLIKEERETTDVGSTTTTKKHKR